jgi:hypothetical protein
MRIDTSNRTLTQLRAFTTIDVLYNPVVRLSDNGKEGAFEYDNTDTTSTDNTGTVIVTASGARYKRIDLEDVLSSWFDNTNAGFQAFINAAAGKVGVINNSFSLTTTINMESGHLIQRKGISVTTSAAVGFLWTRKKNFIGDGLNWTSSNATLGNTIVKIDGLWNASFNSCVFDISGNSAIDIIQLLPGNSGDVWGTYFVVFNNMKTAGGRYVCKADGMTSGASYITNITFNFCWATGGVSYIKAFHAEDFNIHRITADSMSGHVFDLDYASNFAIETNEATPGSGFYTLNETANCNKNICILAKRVTDFTSNLDTLGFIPNSLTLQGSNLNSDNFRARLSSVFSYLGSLFLQAKGGTNTWIDIIKWSEAIGTIFKAGYNNYLKFQEPRISFGATDQIKKFVKTITATSSQNQDVLLFSLGGASNAVSADINIYYRSNDNTVSVMQKIFFTATVSAGGTVNQNYAVVDQLITGATVIPLIDSFYSGSGFTVAITHSNVALAATMDIEVNWSGTSSIAVS